MAHLDPLTGILCTVTPSPPRHHCGSSRPSALASSALSRQGIAELGTLLEKAKAYYDDARKARPARERLDYVIAPKTAEDAEHARQVARAVGDAQVGASVCCVVQHRRQSDCSGCGYTKIPGRTTPFLLCLMLSSVTRMRCSEGAVSVQEPMRLLSKRL